jgi:hypothetical protein
MVRSFHRIPGSTVGKGGLGIAVALYHLQPETESLPVFILLLIHGGSRFSSANVKELFEPAGSSRQGFGLSSNKDGGARKAALKRQNSK